MNLKPEEDLLGCNIADVVVGAGSCIIKVVFSKHQNGLYIMNESPFSTAHFIDWSSNRLGNQEKGGVRRGRKRQEGQVRWLHRFRSREQVTSMTMRRMLSPMATVSEPCLFESKWAEVVKTREVKMMRGQIWRFCNNSVSCSNGGAFCSSPLKLDRSST